LAHLHISFSAKVIQSNSPTFGRSSIYNMCTLHSVILHVGIFISAICLHGKARSNLVNVFDLRYPTRISHTLQLYTKT